MKKGIESEFSMSIEDSEKQKVVERRFFTICFLIYSLCFIMIYFIFFN